MNRTIKNANVLILAAGISKRMESLKAFLPFDEKNNFFEKIAITYSDWGCNKMVVVVNQSFLDELLPENNLPSGIEYVINNQPEFERFYSVKLGLQKMDDIDFCFIQNIDNPFISVEILDSIYRHRSQDAFVIPSFNNRGGHPVLINRSNIERIKLFPENNANLREVLGEMPSLKVEMKDETVLININNATEYKKYFSQI